MAGVSVDGVEIPRAAILAEAQHHPAASAERALAEAARALAIRALLLRRAERLDLVPVPDADPEGRRETDEDALIRQLLEAEVSVPEADEATCRRYYDSNPARFTSPDLYEAAHILFACDPAETDTYEKAAAEAERVIATLNDHPDRFEAIARARSDCSSAKDGGRLGQVARGDTVPEFETFLVALEEGQICPVPVRSRYGVHVLRLDRRIEGRRLPFELVHERIGGYLREASWRRAVAQYIKVLAGQAAISGVDLARTSSPLVQ